jgi:CHAD domain-containing protein
MAREQTTTIGTELLALLERVAKDLNAPNASKPKKVHATRKSLKRARALLRLARPALRKEAYARTNRRLRDIGRSVSPLRDARASVDILASVRERMDKKSVVRELAPLAKNLRMTLAQRQARSEHRRVAKRAASALVPVIRQLRFLFGQLSTATVIDKGLRRIYRRGRRALDMARSKQSPLNLHELRKQAKYLRNAIDGEGIPVRHPRDAKKFNILADWLGEYHDLDVLLTIADRDKTPLKDNARKSLVAAIKRREDKLQRRSLRLAKRLFARKPRTFVAHTSVRARHPR